MFTSFLDAIVQAMSERYEPNQVWLVVNVIAPFLLYGVIAIIAWSVVGRIIRKWRAH